MDAKSYADCIFIWNVSSIGRSSYDHGCRACKKRYCLRGEECNFYKSSSEYFLDGIDGYAERKDLYV